jgi:hypothetical protein
MAQPRPTVVLEHVATYRSNGAHRYLRELRRGLAACTGSDQQGARWTILATGVSGDESLLLRRRVYIDYADTFHDSDLMVARAGRVLVVVADVGWDRERAPDPGPGTWHEGGALRRRAEPPVTARPAAVAERPMLGLPGVVAQTREPPLGAAGPHGHADCCGQPE